MPHYCYHDVSLIVLFQTACSNAVYTMQAVLRRTLDHGLSERLNVDMLLYLYTRGDCKLVCITCLLFINVSQKYTLMLN